MTRFELSAAVAGGGVGAADVGATVGTGVGASVGAAVGTDVGALVAAVAGLAGELEAGLGVADGGVRDPSPAAAGATEPAVGFTVARVGAFVGDGVAGVGARDAVADARAPADVGEVRGTGANATASPLSANAVTTSTALAASPVNLPTSGSRAQPMRRNTLAPTRGIATSTARPSNKVKARPANHEVLKNKNTASASPPRTTYPFRPTGKSDLPHRREDGASHYPDASRLECLRTILFTLCLTRVARVSPSTTSAAFDDVARNRSRFARAARIVDASGAAGTDSGVPRRGCCDVASMVEPMPHLPCDYVVEVT
jgi:hypothetical protein